MVILAVFHSLIRGLIVLPITLRSHKILASILTLFQDHEIGRLLQDLGFIIFLTSHPILFLTKVRHYREERR